MTFFSREVSIENGRPALLFKVYRVGMAWYYTNMDQDMTFMGQLYTALPIRMPSVLQTGDAKAESLEITFPAIAAVCIYLDTFVPTSVISIMVRRVHVDEAPVTGVFSLPTNILDAPIIWMGELYSVGKPTHTTRLLQCNTLSVSLARGGLRLSWGRMCPHALYGRGCSVNKALHAYAIPTLTVVDNVTIRSTVLATHPDGAAAFAGGFLQWDSSLGVTERTGIELALPPNSVTLMGSTRGMASGSNFVAYVGCNRTAQTCHSKFNNLLNYGGINHLQGINPFSGKPIY